MEMANAITRSCAVHVLYMEPHIQKIMVVNLSINGEKIIWQLNLFAHLKLRQSAVGT